jgi:hypothetical protein
MQHSGLLRRGAAGSGCVSGAQPRRCSAVSPGETGATPARYVAVPAPTASSPAGTDQQGLRWGIAWGFGKSAGCAQQGGHPRTTEWTGQSVFYCERPSCAMSFISFMSLSYTFDNQRCRRRGRRLGDGDLALDHQGAERQVTVTKHQWAHRNPPPVQRILHVLALRLAAHDLEVPTAPARVT